jgi:hypothetical protein
MEFVCYTGDALRSTCRPSYETAFGLFPVLMKCGTRRDRFHENTSLHRHSALSASLNVPLH